MLGPLLSWQKFSLGSISDIVMQFLFNYFSCWVTGSDSHKQMSMFVTLSGTGGKGEWGGVGEGGV